MKGKQKGRAVGFKWGKAQQEAFDCIRDSVKSNVVVWVIVCEDIIWRSAQTRIDSEPLCFSCER